MENMWKESMLMMMHDNPTEKVNAEYVADIKNILTPRFRPEAKSKH